MRSLTSSSSCNSATDIHSPSSRTDERRGNRPIQTDARKSKASVCVVKRRTADFPLTCQSTNSFLPIIGAKGYLPARTRLDGGRGELYPAPGRLDWPAMEDDGGDVLGNLPRTRPGRRSEKRTSSQAPAARREDPAVAPGRVEPDPVGDVIRTTAGVAQAGVKVANGITRELLRRLP